jgi:hypothetical protein
MAQRITVEGTITPSTFLASGERRTVTRTAFVEKLISKGFIRVVEDEPKPTVADPVPVQQTMAEVEQAAVESSEPARLERKITEAPHRNGSREEWAKFLDSQKIAYPDDATRNELIDRWDSVSG